MKSTLKFAFTDGRALMSTPIGVLCAVLALVCVGMATKTGFGL
jgi:hypothetical protein